MDSRAVTSTEFRQRLQRAVKNTRWVFTVGEPTRPLFVLFSIAILAIGAVRFLYEIDTPSVFLDEAVSWSNVSGSWEELFGKARAAQDCGGIVFSAALKVWIHVFGTSELSLRMPAVIATLAFVALMLRVGLLLWGRRAGLYVGLAACLHADTLMFARQARAYGFLLAFTALAFLGFALYWRRSQSRGTWVLAIACPLIVLSHVFGFFVVAGITLAQSILWWQSTRSPRRTTSLLRATWPQLASLAISVAWSFVMRSRVERIMDNFWSTEAQLGTMLSSYRVLLDEWAWIAVGAALMIWGRAERSHRAAAVSIIAVALSVSLGPSLVPSMTQGNHHFVVSRYMLAIIPCAALACGYALSRAPSALGLLLALLIFWEPLVHPPAWHYAPNAHGQDARSASQFLVDQMREDDAIIVVPPWSFEILDYYGVPSLRHDGLRLVSAWHAGELEGRLWIAVFDQRRLPTYVRVRIADCAKRKLGGIAIYVCER